MKGGKEGTGRVYGKGWTFGKKTPRREAG